MERWANNCRTSSGSSYQTCQNIAIQCPKRIDFEWWHCKTLCPSPDSREFQMSTVQEGWMQPLGQYAHMKLCYYCVCARANRLATCARDDWRPAILFGETLRIADRSDILDESGPVLHSLGRLGRPFVLLVVDAHPLWCAVATTFCGFPPLRKLAGYLQRVVHFSTHT